MRRPLIEPTETSSAVGDKDAATRRAGRVNDRRCVVSGAPLGPKDPALRFVCSPEGTLAFDIAGRLPGRGAWIGASGDLLRKALEKGAFSRSLRSQVTVPGGADKMVATVEVALENALLARLGLAQRAGLLVLGFEKVRAMMKTGNPQMLVIARDAAADGRDKLVKIRAARGAMVPLLAHFPSSRLSQALGVGNFVFGAVKPGPVAGGLRKEYRRLAGFCPIADFS